jgi:hypothetical protein
MELSTSMQLATRYDDSATIIYKVNPEEYKELTLNDIYNIDCELVYNKSRRELLESQLKDHARKLNTLQEYLIDNYDSLEMHADEIAEMFDLDLSREVTYSVSLSATVTVSVKPGEDAESLISDNLYVDSNHGDITVDDYEIDYTNES